MIKHVIIPSNLIVILFLIGLIFLLLGKKRRLSFSMFLAAFMMYVLFGTGVISLWLLGTLEHRYPPLKSREGMKQIETIVVLTAYAERHPKLPVSSEVNFASAYRLIEAMKIAAELPKAKILISGGGEVPEIMEKIFTSIGLLPKRIIVENRSLNTFESALNIRKIVHEKPFILVTSAGHMPRAMKTFQKAGMKPIPAPTNYMSVVNYCFIHYLPSPLHLSYSDLAIHEYLGIAWYRLNNRL